MLNPPNPRTTLQPSNDPITTPSSTMTSSPSILPCIQALYLTEATSRILQELAHLVKADQHESGQAIPLAAKTMIEAKNWSTISVSAESWTKVTSIRTQLMDESLVRLPSLIPSP